MVRKTDGRAKLARPLEGIASDALAVDAAAFLKMMRLGCREWISTISS
jgi:hypothetical protein